MFIKRVHKIKNLFNNNFLSRNRIWLKQKGVKLL